MKKTDDVYFITLIDFLIQIIFFGLLLFVAYQGTVIVAKQESDTKYGQIETLLSQAGVSSITELTDDLSKLAPIDSLKGDSDFLTKNGGRDIIDEKLSKLRKIEDGIGKPHCLRDELRGGRTIPLAKVTTFENKISFEQLTPELEDVLHLLNLPYESIETMSLGDFNNVFSRLLDIRPECRYSLVVNETTRFVEPRDVIEHSFYRIARKQ